MTVFKQQDISQVFKNFKQLNWLIHNNIYIYIFLLLSQLFGVGHPSPQFPHNPISRIINTYTSPLHITLNHTQPYLFRPSFSSISFYIRFLY